MLSLCVCSAKKVTVLFWKYSISKNNYKKSSTNLTRESSNLLLLLKMAFWATSMSLVRYILSYSGCKFTNCAPFSRVTWRNGANSSIYNCSDISDLEGRLWKIKLLRTPFLVRLGSLMILKSIWWNFFLHFLNNGKLKKKHCKFFCSTDRYRVITYTLYPRDSWLHDKDENNS